MSQMTLSILNKLRFVQSPIFWHNVAMTMTITRNPNLTVPLKLNITANNVQNQFGDLWWTGVPPEKCYGFNFEKKYLQALPLLNLDICTRQDVLAYFDNTWTLTEILFQGLKSTETYIRSPYHQLRHPLMFYYGHTAVLFINKLRLAGLVSESTDLYLEKVLETGVDEMSWDDMSKNEMLWPSIQEIHNYRKNIYHIIKNLILNHPDIEKRTEKKLESPLWALWMGFEHEKIHFETSSVLIRELPIELVEAPLTWAPVHPSAKNKYNVFPELEKDYKKNSWITHSSQTVTLGKSRNEKSFGWDNEYGQRKINLNEFQLTENLITNGEYYEFVKSGAYIQDQYWSSEGLQWRKFRNTKRPTFWMASGPEGLHEYKLRTIFSIIDMPWDWPVEVNHHEAKAYCAWKESQDKTKLKYRLLTEAEFAVQRKNLKSDPVLQNRSYLDLSSLDLSSFENQTTDFNFNFKWSSAMPVDQSVMGNVWHLIEDQINPLDDFKIHPLYDDFTTPCFDGKHHMILGGSFISCGHEASVWARFHFRPHFYQHSGFRMAATLDGSADNKSFKFGQTIDYIHQRRASVLDQIKTGDDWYKKIEQPLEPSSADIKNILQTTQDKIINFYNDYESMKASGTAHDPSKNFVRDGFKVPYQTVKNFPAYGQNFSEQLKLIFDELAPMSQLPGHPGYAAYVSGSANIFSNVAQIIAQTLNPFTGHYMMAPGFVTLEAEAINWFLNLFKFPAQTSIGYFTSGGSQANLAALSMARKNILKSSDLSRAKIYASDQAHHCIGKALDFLGFPVTALQKIETNQNLTMNIENLEKNILSDISQGFIPMTIIGTAGSTNTGAVDELNKISEISKKYKIWFHVDGAYGALFMLTQDGKNKLHGIEFADSIAFDPHKALCLPYGTGGLLVRDKKNIQYDYLSSSSYMPPSPDQDDVGLQVDYADLSVELSRDWRGLRVWLPIKTLGIEPFILNLEEKLKLTEWIENQISQISGLEIFQKSQLSIVSFKVTGKTTEESNLKTQNLIEKINNDNVMFLSACMINGQKIIRICLLGHRLHYARLEKFRDQLEKFTQEINV